MLDDTFQEVEQEIKDKDSKIKKLEQKLIDKTIEINKLQRDRARFLDNLSHDLATPLTPIISLLPLVKEEIKDEKLIEIVDTCIRSAEYIKRVVHNSRELAEINAIDFLLKKENLFEMIDFLLKKYEVIFKTANIQIENNISHGVHIKTEKNKFIKLLDHITSNAVNSMPNGGTLTFDSKPVHRDSGTFIQISIKDTGIGLTREQTDRLFDEFYKTDESRHKLDSTGLGLTICKSIIEKHGGKIWADSHGLGTGVTIHFTLPSDDIVFDRSFL
jgi:signal transduction histidine kinase